MKALVIAGGSINFDFVKRYINQNEYDILIACDKGLETIDVLGISADLIVGDFDSVDNALIKRYETDPKTAETVMRFRPEKDYTDSHLSVERAIKMGADCIDILGATGNRLDHVFGVIAVMNMALKKGISVNIIDDNNKIVMTDSVITIQKKNQFGKYLSVIPYGGNAKGVTIKGAKYEVTDIDLNCDESLGVSNEIKDDVVTISVKEGTLLIVESDCVIE